MEVYRIIDHPWADPVKGTRDQAQAKAERMNAFISAEIP
jgi:hypothetical protein